MQSNLCIIRGKCVMFTHFEDVTTKVLVVGSDCIVWAKRAIKGTHICTKETETLFNLKTKRLNMGWMEGTFNEVNFVEGG